MYNSTCDKHWTKTHKNATSFQDGNGVLCVFEPCGGGLFKITCLCDDNNKYLSITNDASVSVYRLSK